MADRHNQSIDEFDKLELQECYNAIRAFLERRTQLVVFFGTSNVACLGFAVQYKEPWLILLGGLSLIVFLIVDGVLRGNLSSYYYTASRIESTSNREQGLVTIQMLSYANGLQILNYLKTFHHKPDCVKMSRELRRTFTKPFGFRAKRLSQVIIIAALAELIIGVVLVNLRIC